MQTQISPDFAHTEAGQMAESILRRCVHCGFCNATCPTFQITGDELDGPRGRIYQMKQVFEGKPATASIQQHLDRCLTCRNCETTCPSGVTYGRLLDLGRAEVDRQLGRKPVAQFQRRALRYLVTNPALFARSYRVGQSLRNWLPTRLREKVLPYQPVAAVAAKPAQRKVLMLAGCVQPAMLPGINQATIRILNALSVETVIAAEAGCCGAVNLHLDAHEAALDDMRRNIDAWWPYIESGVEAVFTNASACGGMVKDYGFHLRHDAAYADKAAKISALCVDAAQWLANETETLRERLRPAPVKTVAYHPPCSLQHGQKLPGVAEKVLSALGIQVLLPYESNLCCGSAGTYALLQPELSQALKQRKLGHLNALKPEVILSANVGCIGHLAASSQVPVRHWLEYVADLLDPAAA